MDLVERVDAFHCKPSDYGKVKRRLALLSDSVASPPDAARSLLPRQKRRDILRPPMNRLFTTLLIWLLMAALPLHAVAASINTSCAPTQRHTEPAPVASHGVGHASHEHARAAAVDAHAHHGEHAEPVDKHSSEADPADLSHTSCSACSAFCVGAVAPPSSSLSLPSFDGAEAVVVARAEFVTGFIPEGLQRPPRPAIS